MNRSSLEVSCFIAFVLWSGLWRVWLGGIPRYFPFEKGLTLFKYLVAVLVIVTYTRMVEHQTNYWVVSLVAVYYLALWRALPQSLDDFPLAGSTKDPLLKLMGLEHGSTSSLAWWSYGIMRYSVITMIFMAALWNWLGLHVLWLLGAGLSIPLYYRIAWLVKETLPYSWLRILSSVGQPDDYEPRQHYHFAEMLSGMIVAMAISNAVRVG